jgi:hypothetical protein
MAKIMFGGTTVITDGTTHAKQYEGSWSVNVEEGVQTLVSSTSETMTDVDAELVGPPLKESEVQLGGSTRLIGVNISTLYANVASDFGLYGSHDGKNWFAVTEMSTDITPDVVGTYMFSVDLSGYPSGSVAWWRLSLNDEAATIEAGSSGACNFLVSGFDKNVSLSPTNIGGVGADPS